MYSEDDLISISALQHYLYCPRQCALIHVERAWAENLYTAEGKQLHARAHDGRHETRPGTRVERTMPVRSLAHGLAGQCDVVEFHADGSVIPVEYKRGKPKAHRADEVQLCAQALCLEEMLGCVVPTGLLFYGQTRRREQVPMDVPLRTLTLATLESVRMLIADGSTPPGDYSKKLCANCSLLQQCLPRTKNQRQSAAAWLRDSLIEDSYQ